MSKAEATLDPPLVDENDLDVEQYLRNSRDFVTQSETTTRMPPATLEAKQGSHSFKNPFKKPDTEESPKKGTKRPVHEDPPTSESDHDQSDEEEEEDEELPEPEIGPDGGTKWHPNPHFPQDDDPVVDLSETLKKSTQKERERDEAKAKTKAKPKRRRLISSLSFVDDAATESTSKEEKDEEDALKPEKADKKKKNRCIIASYTGDAPYLQLEKSANRLLVVKSGKPLRCKKQNNDSFDAELLNEIQLAHVYWVFQSYKNDSKPAIYIPCVYTADGYVMKMLASHWRDIKKRLSRQLIEFIIKNSNKDPRITKEAQNKDLHKDVHPHFGKVPLVPENIYHELLKVNASTPGMQVKTKPSTKPAETISPNLLPKEKGQLTLAQCTPPPKEKGQLTLAQCTPIAQVASSSSAAAIKPMPMTKKALTPVPEIVQLLEDCKQKLQAQIGPIFKESMFVKEDHREVLLVDSVKAFKIFMDTPEFKTQLKFFWLTNLIANETLRTQALEWMGHRPVAEPSKPAPPLKDAWMECVQMLAESETPGK